MGESAKLFMDSFRRLLLKAYSEYDFPEHERKYFWGTFYYIIEQKYPKAVLNNHLRKHNVMWNGFKSIALKMQDLIEFRNDVAHPIDFEDDPIRGVIRAISDGELYDEPIVGNWLAFADSFVKQVKRDARKRKKKLKKERLEKETKGGLKVKFDPSMGSIWNK